MAEKIGVYIDESSLAPLLAAEDHDEWLHAEPEDAYT